MKQDKEHAVISWIAPEYIQHNKDKKWYLIAFIICAVSVILALILDNWTMALAIITFAGVYHYVQTTHPPKDIAIIITELGIHIGELFIPFSHINAFWIIYSAHNKTLNLHVKNRIYSEYIIQLNGQNPSGVRNYLLGQIAEWEGKQERFIDIVLRLFKL